MINLSNINQRILDAYAAAIKNMTPVKSEYDKRKLREQARRMGLVKWTDRQRLKVGGVGFLTGLPGGLAILPMLVADVTYLMAIAGRGCYGVGHILNRKVDYKRDIPMIIAIWSGAAHVASAASVGRVALQAANPVIVQVASNAAVGASALAIQTLAGQTGSKVLALLMPKFLAKIAAQMATKTVSMSVPLVGGVASVIINRWVCAGLMHAAEKYYLAEYVVLEGDPND